MSENKPKRTIQHFELDESKVAVFLFRLFRQAALSQKKTLAPRAISNDAISNVRSGIHLMYDFVKQTERESTKEICEKLKGDLKILGKSNLSWADFWLVIKNTVSIGSDLIGIDFLEFLLESTERREKIIKMFRMVAEISIFIPFETFSLTKIVERYYEPYIRELSGEIDAYINQNYNLTFNSVVLFGTSITLIITIAAPWGKIPEFISNIPHSSFYFGVAVFFLYITIIFSWLFMHNVYQQRKRSFMIRFLESITAPIQDPDLIDDEYLTHILKSFKFMLETKSQSIDKSEYEKNRRFLKYAMNIRSWSFRESICAHIWIIWQMLIRQFWPIFLTISYITLAMELFFSLNRW